MDKKQKIAIIVMPVLAIAILFGASSLRPGVAAETYEGVGKGYYGDIRVRVSILEDTIQEIEILEISDTPGFGDKAAEETIERIIEAQSTKVDAVSGATASSEGTIAAVKNAIGQHFGLEGVGKGYYGDIRVRVKLDGDKIQSIEIVEISDTPGFGDKAAEETAERIIEAQSTDIDAVSGATASSEGTIEAVKNALSNE